MTDKTIKMYKIVNNNIIFFSRRASLLTYTYKWFQWFQRFRVAKSARVVGQRREKRRGMMEIRTLDPWRRSELIWRISPLDHDAPFIQTLLFFLDLVSLWKRLKLNHRTAARTRWPCPASRVCCRKPYTRDQLQFASHRPRTKRLMMKMSGKNNPSKMALLDWPPWKSCFIWSDLSQN